MRLMQGPERERAIGERKGEEIEDPQAKVSTVKIYTRHSAGF